MVAHLENLADLLGAALGELEEAIAVLDVESRVVYWNPAAVAITGYRSADLLSRRFPPDLYQVDTTRRPVSDTTLQTVPLRAVERRSVPRPEGDPASRRAVLVNLRHSQGHSLPGMLRSTPLRDDLGKRFGTLLRFHPVEEIDTLPRGITLEEGGHERRVEQSQAEMEDRLDEAWRGWKIDAVPFGLLWIAVDQAATLRRTHGQDASEAMLAIIEKTLLHGLRPTEILGRWGTHEFLVLCHERTAERLEAHARHLCGLVRTADFRWWGDRIPLTASVGAAQAGAADGVRSLLERTQQGMKESADGGGNTAVFKGISGSGGAACSQS